jgi:hypothetical protein
MYKPLYAIQPTKTTQRGPGASSAKLAQQQQLSKPELEHQHVRTNLLISSVCGLYKSNKDTTTTDRPAQPLAAQ